MEKEKKLYEALDLGKELFTFPADIYKTSSS